MTSDSLPKTALRWTCLEKGNMEKKSIEDVEELEGSPGQKQEKSKRQEPHVPWALKG